MAVALWLAVAALQCMGGHAEGTGVTRTSRRARYTYWPCERGAGEVGPRGGVVRRRQRGSGEGVCAKERGREGEKGTGGFLTKMRSSGGGPRCQRCSGSGDHRRRGARDDGGYGGSRLEHKRRRMLPLGSEGGGRGSRQGLYRPGQHRGARRGKIGRRRRGSVRCRRRLGTRLTRGAAVAAAARDWQAGPAWQQLTRRGAGAGGLQG